MLHPYKMYEAQTAIADMDMIEATVSLCTVYKNAIPIGPALIEYTDQSEDSEYLSFRGVGVFNEQGILANAAFTCVRGDGEG